MKINKQDSLARVNDRLVGSYIIILKSLLQGETSVNSVIRQTGLKKERVFPALDELSKAKLTSSTVNPKHKQKKMNRLTIAGMELAKLIQSADKFQQLHLKLADLISENFGISSKEQSELKGKLRIKGWTSQEISFFGQWKIESKNFVSISSHLFIGALCSRFLSLVYQYVNSRNELAYRILTKLFTDAIIGQGKILFANEEAMRFTVGKYEATLPSRNESIQRAISFPLADYVIRSIQSQIQDKTSCLNSRLMKDQVKDVVNSVYELINPQGELNSKYGVPIFKF